LTCTHREQITFDIPSDTAKTGATCPDCIAMGSTWVHLRLCLICGHVGCCDSSPNRHARKHWQASSHPIIGSMEMGERWSYCFDDDEFL
jgi:uncharacterized UBP type Zn finger protein